MRRPRQRLQVSTFPFLAVLLCAMGSLILMLLVMDKRAKAVARAKAWEAITKAAEDAKRERELAELARLAAWERLRVEAHESLVAQDRDLQAKIADAKAKLQGATSRHEAEKSRAAELRDQLDASKQGVALLESQIEGKRKEAVDADKLSAAAKAEMARLTGELARLEAALAALKALRAREQQTYSLVPYHGKHGDNRKPIYVECAANAFVFHPDKLSLDIGSTTAADIRAEVERRIARLKAATPPYVLFLVRPDGISHYYEAMAVLNPLQLDYGYELIERDWVLDFPEDGAPGTQPWMQADRAGPRSPPTANLKPPVEGHRPEGVNFGNGNREGGEPASPGAAMQGPRGTESPPAGPGGPPSPTLGPPAAGGDGLGDGGLREKAGQMPGSPPRAPGSPAGMPRLNPTFLDDPPSPDGGKKGQKPGGAPNAQGGQPGDGGEPGEENQRMPGSLPMGPPDKEKARPVRAVPNRELVFRIECAAEVLILYPGGIRFPLGTPGSVQQLTDTVRQMIEKRQASVRPGEAPYRPQVRFLVRPDGLRGYFTAYPMLESLKVPMSRQDIHDEEEPR